MLRNDLQVEELWRKWLLSCGQELLVSAACRLDQSLSRTLPFTRNEIQKFCKQETVFIVKEEQKLQSWRLERFKFYLLRNEQELMDNLLNFSKLLYSNADYAALFTLLCSDIDVRHNDLLRLISVSQQTDLSVQMDLRSGFATFFAALRRQVADNATMPDDNSVKDNYEVGGTRHVDVNPQNNIKSHERNNRNIFEHANSEVQGTAGRGGNGTEPLAGLKPGLKFKNDTLLFFLPPPELEKKLYIHAENIPLDIVYEDDSLMVINKPQGMVVHPAHGNWEGTLLHALAYYFESKGMTFLGRDASDSGDSSCLAETSDITDSSGADDELAAALSPIADLYEAKIGDPVSGFREWTANSALKPLRPGIVHRIDKDTSGLLVVAKTAYAERLLQEMISKHEIRRTYRALAWGTFLESNFTIEGALGKDPQHPLKRAVTQDGKPAVTHVKLLKQYNGFADLEVILETGRTHQIRVHLSSMGHPLVADPLYCSKEYPTYGLQGQCLHAWKLQFTHPVSGKLIDLEAPLPAYYTQLCYDSEDNFETGRGKICRQLLK